MNRNLLFLFFFLASISAINAVPLQFNKRTTTFVACPPIPGNPIDISNVTTLAVTVVPDPISSNQNVTFTMSGIAKENIPTNSSIVVGYTDPSGYVIGKPFVTDFCGDGDSCPVKKGDTFNRTVTAEAPTLPQNYNVITEFGPTNAVYACAEAKV